MNNNDNKKIDKIASVINNSTKSFVELHLLENVGLEMTGTNVSRPRSHAKKIEDDKKNGHDVDRLMSVLGH